MSHPHLACGVTALAVSLAAGGAHAQVQAPPPAAVQPAAPAQGIDRVWAEPVSEGVTQADLAQLKSELARQAQMIAAQQREIGELQAQRDEMLSVIRAGYRASSAAADRAQPVPNAVQEQPPVAPVSPTSAAPQGPVGERPAQEPRQEIAAVPPGVGVLTPRGHFVLDPSVEYVNSSANRLVFRGVELVPGINIGALEVSDAARQTGVATLAARFGLTDRMEVEARVPYVWRHDRVTLVAARDRTFEQTTSLDGRDIGDVEMAARYQLNGGVGGRPIWVANLRVKSPTGSGPYDVNFDKDGAATELATGSGFWGAEGGVTMLYPSDPAIIYGGLAYLHNFSRNIDKTFGSGDSAVRVLDVDPGDSISASVGFGLSLNPRFSVSFGYSHNYIFRTTTNSQQLAGTLVVRTKNRSQSLQVGSLQMGWSFRLFDKLTINNSFDIGVTEAAPDLRVVIRAPYRF